MREEPFGYVKTYYGVPAERGRLVKVYGNPGIITEDRGNYIGVNFDNLKPGEVRNCHPVDGVEYGEMGNIRTLGGLELMDKPNYEDFAVTFNNPGPCPYPHPIYAAFADPNIIMGEVLQAPLKPNQMTNNTAHTPMSATRYFKLQYAGFWKFEDGRSWTRRKQDKVWIPSNYRDLTTFLSVNASATETTAEEAEP